MTKYVLQNLGIESVGHQDSFEISSILLSENVCRLVYETSSLYKMCKCVYNCCLGSISNHWTIHDVVRYRSAPNIFIPSTLAWTTAIIILAENCIIMLIMLISWLQLKINLSPHVTEVKILFLRYVFQVGRVFDWRRRGLGTGVNLLSSRDRRNYRPNTKGGQSFEKKKRFLQKDSILSPHINPVDTLFTEPPRD